MKEEGNAIADRDGEVRMVEVSFSCTKDVVFPSCITRNVQTTVPCVPRGAQQTGLQLFSSTPKVDIYQLIDDLSRADFTLISVGCQSKSDTEYDRLVVRFRFVPEELVDKSGGLPVHVRDELLAGLRDLADKAMWSAFAWQNIWFVDHVATNDRHISVCCAARLPYVDNNGTTITECQKDTSGKKIRGTGSPIHANFTIRLVDGCLRLEPT